MNIKNIIIIIVGIIIVVGLLQYDNDIILIEKDDKADDYSFFQKDGSTCGNKYKRKVEFQNEPNIIEKCATIAKSVGNTLFGIKDNTCYISPESNSNSNSTPESNSNSTPESNSTSECSTKNQIKLFRWNQKLKDNHKNNRSSSNDLIDIKYNINYPPYINLGKMSTLLSNSNSNKNNSMLRVNMLLKKHSMKYGMDTKISPSSELINQAIKYTDGEKFYNEIIIGKKYDQLFKEALGVNIIKVSYPIQSNLLTVGYLPNDKLDTILYKMLMKLKLVYSITLDVQNEISYIRNMIVQIAKRKGFYKEGMLDNVTFDSFLNTNKELRHAIKTSLGFTFISYKDEHITTDKSPKLVNITKPDPRIQQLKEIRTFELETNTNTNTNTKTINDNKAYPSDYKWEEYCDLDQDQTKFSSALKCTDPTGLMVDDELCTQNKPKLTNKCTKFNLNNLDKIKDID